MRYSICCFGGTRTDFPMPSCQSLICVWRNWFKNGPNPTHVAINLFDYVGKRGADFKYVVKAYINKSLLVSPHVTTVLFAPALLPALWLASSWLLPLRQLCWSQSDCLMTLWPVHWHTDSLPSKLTDFCQIKIITLGGKNNLQNVFRS